MKRTKNMYYNPTTESRELFLYAINEGNLYRRCITPIIKNLTRKIEKGIYDTDLAVDAYYHVATEASNLYNKDFGYKFNVTDRFTVAIELEEYYKEMIEFDMNN